MLAATAYHRRIRALLGAAAAVILIGGQLGMLAHNAFVQHRVCAEHQVLEHGDGGHEHALAALPPAPANTASADLASAGESDAVRGSGTDRDSDEHDTCGLTSVTREPACQNAAPVALTPPYAHVRGPSTAPGEVRVGLASYRLAPKQSPPARSA